MSDAPNTYSLVADIGGTNTRIALAQGTAVIETTIRRYVNAEFASLADVLTRFRSDHGAVKLAAACVAVAGPVAHGRADMTNLDWTIDEQTLAHATGTQSVAILNDLQAQGHALGFITSGHMRNLKSGAAAAKHATRLVVGVGTGFNIATVYASEKGTFVTPSESGHGNLPILTPDDLMLSDFITEKHGFAAIEDVLSGRGLEQVYAYFAKSNGQTTGFNSKDILSACAAGSDPIAMKTVSVFAQMLGTVCGNFALMQLPTGGIYLVGGMARAITPFLDAHGFQAAFRAKGRFSDLMDSFPIRVIDDDYAALTGSAAFLCAR